MSGRRGLVAAALLVVLALALVGWRLGIAGHPASSGTAGSPQGDIAAAEAKKLKDAKVRAPGYEIDSLRLVSSNRGVKQFELTVRSVSTDDRTKLATVAGLDRVVVYRAGKVYFTGKAKRGTFNQDTRDVEVQGAIRLANGRGDSFSTERLTYTSSSELLDIPGPVEMVLDGRRIVADRARADIKAETVVAEGNVVIIGSGEEIRGQKLIYGMKDRSMQFVGSTSVELQLE